MKCLVSWFWFTFFFFFLSFEVLVLFALDKQQLSYPALFWKYFSSIKE